MTRITRRRFVWLSAGVFLLALAGRMAWRLGTSAGRLEGLEQLRTEVKEAGAGGPLQGDEDRIVAFCGDCHALPRPESLPRDRWYDGVRAGFEQYARSGRVDLVSPRINEVVAYYRARSPRQHQFTEPPPISPSWRARFRVEQWNWERETGAQPAVSTLRWCRLGASEKPVLLISDMRDGRVVAVDPRVGEGKQDATADPRSVVMVPKVIGKFQFPCRVELCDLEGNGSTGILVAELGSFSAVDHDLGRVIWLRRVSGHDDFELIPLASGLGRVADVRPIDADGDGRLDVIVAEFGHRNTGGIVLLRNLGGRDGRPRFVPERLDLRTGTVQIPVCDLNGDGKPDFVALISNESECVEAYLNQGQGRYLVHPIWQAPDLTFGSSSVAMVDLDRDGDLDVLYTNGDSFDNLYANPSHGVQWLENGGSNGWVCHRLADLPGAYCAAAGDLDLDGDLDIVVAAWLPRQVLPVELRAARPTSLLVLEQKAPGIFEGFSLATEWPHHAVMEMADFDGDGDTDFAVGYHTGLDGEQANHLPRVAVWWNQAMRSPRPE